MENWSAAQALQRALQDGALQIVARGAEQAPPIEPGTGVLL